MSEISENFEPKEGLYELQKRLYALNPKQVNDLFYQTLGAFTSKTHKEWKSYKETMELLLPEIERQEVKA